MASCVLASAGRIPVELVEDRSLLASVARIDNVYGDRNLRAVIHHFRNTPINQRKPHDRKQSRPKSGDKIINDVGVKAIKNGQKRRTDE